MATTTVGSSESYRLAKVAGVFAVCASALSQEYGSGINFVMVNSLSQYPAVKWLVPLAMLTAGIVLIPKVALFARLSSIAPRAGSSYVWLTRSLGLRLGFVVSFLWFVGVLAGGGFLAHASATFVGAFLLSIGLPALWCTTTIGHLIIGLAAIWILFAIHDSGVHNYATFVTIMFVFVIVAAVLTVAYFWAPLAIIIAIVLLQSVIVLPKTPWMFRPSFQGVIAVLIAIWLYMSARARDATIASRAEQLTAE